MNAVALTTGFSAAIARARSGTAWHGVMMT
jgi:hypothetical protein